MKTIEEIRVITQEKKEFVEVCTKFIENIIEPNILIRAKNGYVRVYIDTTCLSSSQIEYIINVYEEKGYEVDYRAVADEIEIYWGEEREREENV